MNTPYNNDDLFAENNIIDLKEILRKYLDYKLWFVVSVLISLAIAFFYLRHTPITYFSSAKIKLLTDAEAATIQVSPTSVPWLPMTSTMKTKSKSYPPTD